SPRPYRGFVHAPEIKRSRDEEAPLVPLEAPQDQRLGPVLGRLEDHYEGTPDQEVRRSRGGSPQSSRVREVQGGPGRACLVPGLRYAKARGRTDGEELYEGLKKRQDLAPITSQPLLNYLVAFLASPSGDLSQLPGNLSEIYQQLLIRIWERPWDGAGQVP